MQASLEKDRKKKFNLVVIGLAICVLLLGTVYIAYAAGRSGNSSSDTSSSSTSSRSFSGTGSSSSDSSSSDSDASSETTGSFRSWVRDDTEDTREYVGTLRNDEEQIAKDNPGPVEKALSTLMVNVATALDNALQRGKIDASTTGILLGNVMKSNSSGIPYFFVFDLTDNNMWGVLGAIVYVVIRSLMIGLLFIFVLFSLLKVMWSSQAGKDFASLKEVVYASIIAMVLLFIMPQVVDWLCNIRDALQVVIYKIITAGADGIADEYSLLNTATGSIRRSGYNAYSLHNITDNYYKLWYYGPDEAKIEDIPIWTDLTGLSYAPYSKSLVYGIIYTALCMIPFFYMGSYIKIAFEQVVLFGAFPAFCVLSVRNKQLMSNWFVTFITNIFIPVFDILIISLPLLLQRVMASNGVDTSSLVATIILVVAMTAAIPARNKLLQMLGAGFGVPMGGKGFSALAGIGAMAIGAARDLFGGIRGGIAGGSNGRTSTDDKMSGADVAAAEDAARADAKDLSEQKKELDDINGIKNPADENGAPNLADISTAEEKQQEGAEALTDEQKQEENDTVMSAESDAAINADDIQTEQSGDDAMPEDEEVGADINANVDENGNPVGEDDVYAQNEQMNTADLTPEEFAAEAQKGDDGAVSGEEIADVKQQGMVADPALQEEIEKNADLQMGRRQFGESRQEYDAQRAEIANNLTNRATNLERMDHLEKQSDAIKEANAKAKSDAQGYKTESNRAQQHINDLKAENSDLYKMRKDGADPILPSGVSASHKIEQNDAAIAKYQSEKLKADQSFEKEQNRISQNNGKLAKIQTEMGQRKNLEQGFAAAAGRAGHSNQAFDNAAEFKRSLSHENRLAQAATYQNYKSKDVYGALSARERKQYQAEASRREAARVVGRVAGGAVGAAAGIGVAAAASLGAAYGGDEAMANTFSTIGRPAMTLGLAAGGAAGGAVGGAVSTGVERVAHRGDANYVKPTARQRRMAAMDTRIANQSARRAQAIAARKQAEQRAQWAAVHKQRNTVARTYMKPVRDGNGKVMRDTQGQVITRPVQMTYTKAQHQQFMNSLSENERPKSASVKVLGNVYAGATKPHVVGDRPSTGGGSASAPKPRRANHETVSEGRKGDAQFAKQYLAERERMEREEAQKAMRGNSRPGGGNGGHRGDGSGGHRPGGGGKKNRRVNTGGGSNPSPAKPNNQNLFGMTDEEARRFRAAFNRAAAAATKSIDDGVLPDLPSDDNE